ncbi:unnamed protein product [Ixodes pacificus]
MAETVRFQNALADSLFCLDQIQRNERHILSAPMVILDGNLSVDTISYTLGMCRDRKIPERQRAMRGWWRTGI